MKLTFSEYLSPKSYVWTPDSIDVEICHPSSSEPEHLTYASLEKFFRLLELLEREEAREIAFGTEMLPVTVEGDQIALEFAPRLVGYPEQMRASFYELVQKTFERLQREGFDTATVAKNIAEGSLETHVDPVAVHDRLME